ncbi:hypothetical protein FOMPIDRAFT_1023808 [Fomitopsis schrenkii]|uniref:Uncharacterized protein n=1 Tax=Fomitopsis schrenkii TaxID=2126942 RepID=S8EAZ1_FOMSC|nr:hypothetical protein FOMPIDRAFT_1023808 [Fomitopsis schrenkii]
MPSACARLSPFTKSISDAYMPICTIGGGRLSSSSFARACCCFDSLEAAVVALGVDPVGTFRSVPVSVSNDGVFCKFASTC